MEILDGSEESDSNAELPVAPEGRVISPQQQALVLAARELLMTYAGELVVEPWEGRSTTLREKARIIGHAMLGRRQELAQEYPSLFWRQTVFVCNRWLRLGASWGGQWDELSQELMYDAEQGLVTQETLNYATHPLLLGLPGYTPIAWSRQLEQWHNLLHPIQNPEWVAELQSRLDAILEQRRAIRTTSEQNQ